MRIRYTSRAGNDLDIAFEWYEGQRRGLGFDFLDCVEVTIETIQRFTLFDVRYSTFSKLKTFL